MDKTPLEEHQALVDIFSESMNRLNHARVLRNRKDTSFSIETTFSKDGLNSLITGLPNNNTGYRQSIYIETVGDYEHNIYEENVSTRKKGFVEMSNERKEKYISKHIPMARPKNYGKGDKRSIGGLIKTLAKGIGLDSIPVALREKEVDINLMQVLTGGKVIPKKNNLFPEINEDEFEDFSYEKLKYEVILQARENTFEGKLPVLRIGSIQELFSLLEETGPLEELLKTSKLPEYINEKSVQKAYKTLFMQHAAIDMIERYFNTYQSINPGEYLNNFTELLAGGYYKDIYSSPKKRERLLGKDLKNIYGYSEKYLKSTAREFFDDIDAATIEANFSAEEIEILRTTLEIVEFGNTTFPIYLALRRRGYSHRDLKGQVY